MSIMLGDLDVSNIEKRLGITLEDNDRETLISMRQHDAQNIQPGKWHCFDIPFTCACGGMEAAIKVRDIMQKYSSDMKGQFQISLAIDDR